MQEINIDTWNRKEHFDFFYRMDYPQYNICVNLDITNFLKYTKEKGLPFYYSMIFVATKATEAIENFRYRIRGGKVVLHDSVHPSFTDINKDDDLFKFVALEFDNNIAEFCQKAKLRSIQQVYYLDMKEFENRDDLLYFTCIPWFSFTHISHTISINHNDSIPLFAWGKYFEQDSKNLLPFSVQVNHALVDGSHVGKYLEALEQIMNYIEFI